MAVKAHNLDLSEDLVDPNSASVGDLQSLLPGVGEVLASRIVAYRESHGPFEQMSDLTKVSGIGDKLVARMASHLSLPPTAPFSGYSRLTNSRAPLSSPHNTAFPHGAEPDYSLGARAFSSPSYSPRIEEDAAFAESEEEFFRKPIDEAVFLSSTPEPFESSAAPEIESFLLRGQIKQTQAPEARALSQPAAPPARMTNPAPRSLRAPQEVEVEAGEIVPLSRPWRVWLVVAGIALMSGTVGSIYGIRSQDGGPRAVLEQQVVRSLDGVVDLKGSVKDLQEQSTTFATSINALDTRLSDEERARGIQGKRLERAVENNAPSSPKKDARVRENVRRALRTLDPYLGQPRAGQVATGSPEE